MAVTTPSIGVHVKPGTQKGREFIEDVGAVPETMDHDEGRPVTAPIQIVDPDPVHVDELRRGVRDGSRPCRQQRELRHDEAPSKWHFGYRKGGVRLAASGFSTPPHPQDQSFRRAPHKAQGVATSTWED